MANGAVTGASIRHQVEEVARRVRENLAPTDGRIRLTYGRRRCRSAPISSGEPTYWAASFASIDSWPELGGWVLGPHTSTGLPCSGEGQAPRR